MKKDKADKDLSAAKEIGEFLLGDPHQRSKLRGIFDALPKKWQEKIRASIKTISPELHSFISTDSLASG